MAYRKIITGVFFFLAGSFFAPSARAFTVSGTISDEQGRGVAHIKVCLMDYNYVKPNREIQCVETDKNGRYSGTVAPKDDVYLLVYYESPLDPGTPSLAPGKKARVVYDNAIEPITFSTAWKGGYLPSIAANGEINIPAGPGRPALGAEIIGLIAVHDAFEFIRTQGVSNFKGSYDIKVDISTSDDNLWPYATGEDATLHLGVNRLQGDAPEWYSVYHETGHIIQYQAYSPPAWPKSKYPGGKHVRNSYSDEGFALLEGWAEAFGDLLCKKNGHKGGDTARTAWRGGGVLQAAGGALDSHSGSDNSGEVVEGSICEIIKGTQFKYVLEGMIELSPDAYRGVMIGFSMRSGEGQDLLDLFTLQRRWGIVYTRAKFDGFNEGEPAGGDEEAGNSAVIDQLTFLRGVVHPKYAENTKQELNLASSTGDIQEIQMGYKEAVDEFDENDLSVFRKWTPWTGFASPIEFKTTREYDQDLDLILKVKDTHGSWDDYNPDFTGDPIVNKKDYSTNERWLKHLGTWYNRDDYANTDREGKVVLDNNRPLIDEKKFKPRALEHSGYRSGGDGTYVRISP